MSLTPVEEADDGDSTPPSQDSRSGVRARLHSWLVSIGRRVRTVLPSPDSTVASEDASSTQSGQIRVREQQELARQQDGGMDQTEADGPPPARGTLPGSCDVDAEQDGDRLRVYSTEHDDAFVSSDTWEQVEQ